MNTKLLAGLACAGLALGLADTASAHGGQYRGPTDIVPPGGPRGGNPGGPRGPDTGKPNGPRLPGPPGGPGTGGGGTGGNGPGGGPGRGPVTGPGIPVPEDLTTWEFWWEINKDPFIQLKQALHAAQPVSGSDLFYLGAGRERIGRDTLKPSESQILDEILPALARNLDGTSQRDIASSCMVAMAKIGRATAEVDLLTALRARLREKDQEVRETAALAMGISQHTDALPDLLALVADDARGRDLVGDSEVDDRTRAFAAYGLGLIGWATPDPAIDRAALNALAATLDDDSRWNAKVAAVNAIGLLRPDVRRAEGRALLDDCLDTLQTYWERDLGVGEQLVQSHVPPAVAKLVEDVDLPVHPDLAARIDEFRRTWLDAVRIGRPQGRLTNPLIAQSAVVALGRTTAPHEEDAGAFEREVSMALIEHARRGKDMQSRNFALMALGQIGGRLNRDALLDVLRTGTKAIERPWAALALGVMTFRARENDPTGDPGDTLVGERLHRELLARKNPGTIGAVAIGLGLCGYEAAADDLRVILEDHKHQDVLAGYLCVALALLGDHRSLPMIRDLVETSVRRPKRLQQAAIALGKLGDKDAALQLIALLEKGDQNLAKLAALATALGSIGDRRTVAPLIRTLDDEQFPALSRAFAAAALGGIADKELLPWNSKIGANMNYRAAVETLTNRVNGILDIL